MFSANNGQIQYVERTLHRGKDSLHDLKKSPQRRLAGGFEVPTDLRCGG